jgi:DNA polymerase III delta prime subunit
MVSAGGRSLPLTERRRPHRLSEIVGNARAREELRAWAERWSKGTPARRAVLLAGPPGVGKTTAALALAEEFGWTLVEMNASDARNQASIERVAGRASITHTLDAPGRAGPPHALIVLDEADCLTGRASEDARPAPEPLSLREFLQGRYGTIGALNTAWALGLPHAPKSFAAWTSIPRSPGSSAWGKLPAARRDLADWRSAESSSTDLSDRGGLGAISRLVRTTRQPVVLTVNDERPLSRYSPVFRTAVLRLRFAPVPPAEVRSLVERVARSEQIPLAPGVTDEIVRRAQGDVRAALNDLDALSVLPPGAPQRDLLGTRDLSSDFAAFTEEVLNRPRFYRAAEVRDRLDAPPDDLLPWIEESLVRFAPDPRHRLAALERLVVADRMLVRARRFRTYGLWSYASELLAGGIGLSLRDRPVDPGPTAAFPEFLGEMGRTRAARALRLGITAKIGQHAHLSRAKARLLLLPVLEGLLAGPRGRRPDAATLALGRAIAAEFEFGPEEIAYLLGVPPGDPRASRIAAGSDEPSGEERDLEGEAAEEPPAPAGGGSAALPAPAAAPGATGAPKRRQRQLGEFGG